MRALMIALALAAMPAVAQLNTVAPELPAGVKAPPSNVGWCYPESNVCIVTAKDFNANQATMIAAYTALKTQRDIVEKQAARIRELEAKTSDGPKCGVMYVLPQVRRISM